MKKSTIIIVLIAFFIGLNTGAYLTKKQYIKRALQIPEKNFFTNQDIEHILYNTKLN